jgi:hypothetical protein
MEVGYEKELVDCFFGVRIMVARNAESDYRFDGSVNDEHQDCAFVHGSQDASRRD